MKGGSYYGSAVPVADIAHIVSAWGAHVGYDNARAMLENKDARDGGREFHLTLIDPKETRMLRKQGVDLTEIEDAQLRAVPQGVGKQTDESSGNETWFITAESPGADELRSRLGLGTKDYHITLGFTQKDIHGVPKDGSTVVDNVFDEGTANTVGEEALDADTLDAMDTETTQGTDPGREQDPARDVNVEVTLDTLKPAVFDTDDEGNVVIPDAMREKLKEEIDAEYITPAVSEDGQYVMLKYSKAAMYDQRWNSTTVNFRGVLTDPDYRRVYARGFTKFFNVSEHEQRPAFPSLPKDEPVVLAKKMDGSLGLVTHVDGENRVYTSGSARQETNEIASVGNAILAEQLDERGALDWKPPKNITVLTEIISPENPIVVDYQGARRIVVLGAVDNRTGEDVPEDQLADMTPLERVEKIDNGEPMSYADAMTQQIPGGEEGYVLEFQRSGLRAKVKGETYLATHKVITNMSAKNLWESFRDENDTELLENIRKTAPPQAYETVKLAHQKMSEEISARLDDRRAVASRALSEFGVSSVEDIPKEDMGRFIGHLKGHSESKRDFVVDIALARGEEDNARRAVIKQARPHGAISVSSMVSAEESEVGDDADDNI